VPYEWGSAMPCARHPRYQAPPTSDYRRIKLLPAHGHLPMCLDVQSSPLHDRRPESRG